MGSGFQKSGVTLFWCISQLSFNELPRVVSQVDEFQLEVKSTEGKFAPGQINPSPNETLFEVCCMFHYIVEDVSLVGHLPEYIAFIL